MDPVVDTTVKIAFVGCAHGELDKIYDTIIQKKGSVDLLICCGDFEAVRNQDDLNNLVGPKKYHFFKDFYKYYNGEKSAPFPTIFIGGNHEAMNHLSDLYHGGWAAPNIYFLGYSGVVRFGGLRIAGFSGIYKKYDFPLGHFERPPYSENDLRSAYHVRSFQLFRLSQIATPLDIILSHDWLKDTEKHGDSKELFKQKPYLQQDVDDLGCVEYNKLMSNLKPRYWLSGHMHCNYRATFTHDNGSKTLFCAADKADKSVRGPRSTEFLNFLDIAPVNPGPKELYYDEEWLAIIRACHTYTNYTRNPTRLPQGVQNELKQQREWVNLNFIKNAGSLKIPENFVRTVVPHYTTPELKQELNVEPSKFSQTAVFEGLLGLAMEKVVVEKVEKLEDIGSGGNSFSGSFGGQGRGRGGSYQGGRGRGAGEQQGGRGGGGRGGGVQRGRGGDAGAGRGGRGAPVQYQVKQQRDQDFPELK